MGRNPSHINVPCSTPGRNHSTGKAAPEPFHGLFKIIKGLDVPSTFRSAHREEFRLLAGGQGEKLDAHSFTGAVQNGQAMTLFWIPSP